MAREPLRRESLGRESLGREPLRREPLTRLRWKLTGWYVATLALVLVALGGLLFGVLVHLAAADLDASLHAAVREIASAAGRREREIAMTGGGAIDAVEELRIPGRGLYLFDLSGHPVTPAAAPDSLQAVAARAGADGSADGRWRNAPASAAGGTGRGNLEIYAERFATPRGASYVALATADRAALDERYAALMGAFGGVALLGLVLVAGGGWLLAGQSVRPVQQSVAYMRRFMADAAHELRTPIAVLRTRAEVALQRPRTPDAYVAALEQVDRESERLGALVDDLLTLARADAGERPVRRERVRLDEAVLDAVAAASALAERRGVRVDAGGMDEVSVDADPALVRQLAMILLDNAIKFSEPGGVVEASVSRDGKSAGAGQGHSGHASGPQLTVRDAGLGIPPAELPHVFDRFYRGDAVRGTTGGAGLGLAIARWIAGAHGATIDIASAMDERTAGERAARGDGAARAGQQPRGTTVRVTFPEPGRRL
ncbi:MAG TPA: HAMP domain-containing sensor histidine kinase [Gemmatimonadales bacterium]|nr:HAMP domain-containing sensor histidine kinase [Gemmatimonadales bacterium]